MLTYDEKRSLILKIHRDVDAASTCIKKLLTEQSEKLEFIKQKEKELESYYAAILEEIPFKLEYALKVHNGALINLSKTQALACSPDYTDPENNLEARQRSFQQQVSQQLITGVKRTK